MDVERAVHNLSLVSLLYMSLAMPIVLLGKMSVQIIKNKVGCGDDIMPITVDTRRYCQIELRTCNHLLRPHPYILIFEGCRRLLHVLNNTMQYLLVSTVIGMVLSLHPTSFSLTCSIYK